VRDKAIEVGWPLEKRGTGRPRGKIEGGGGGGDKRSKLLTQSNWKFGPNKLFLLVGEGGRRGVGAQIGHRFYIKKKLGCRQRFTMWKKGKTGETLQKKAIQGKGAPQTFKVPGKDRTNARGRGEPK